MAVSAERADPPHGAAPQSERPWRGRRRTSGGVLDSDTHAAGSHTIRTGSRLPRLQLFPIRGQDTSTCQPIRLSCRRPPRLLLLSLPPSASAVILNLACPPLFLSQASQPAPPSPSLPLSLSLCRCSVTLAFFFCSFIYRSAQTTITKFRRQPPDLCSVCLCVCVRTSCCWIALHLELLLLSVGN